jgi:hypothetical protein
MSGTGSGDLAVSYGIVFTVVGAYRDCPNLYTCPSIGLEISILTHIAGAPIGLSPPRLFFLDLPQHFL